MARPSNTERINDLNSKVEDLASNVNQLINALQGGNAPAPTPAPAPDPVQNYTAPKGNNAPLPSTADKAEKHAAARPEIHWSDDKRYVTIRIDTEAKGYLSEKGNIVVGTSGGNITLGETHRGTLRLGLNSYFVQGR